MQTSANNSTRLCYSKKNLLIRELFVYEPIKKDPKLFDLSSSRIPQIFAKQVCLMFRKLVL